LVLVVAEVQETQEEIVAHLQFLAHLLSVLVAVEADEMTWPD